MNIRAESWSRWSVPLAALCAALSSVAAIEAPARDAAVSVEYFFEPGCSECDWLETRFLPDLRARYGAHMAILARPLDRDGNDLRLAECLDALRIKDNASVYVVVDAEEAFAGLAAIRDRLLPALDRRVIRRLERERFDSGEPDRPSPPLDGASVFRKRVYEEFTVPGVLLAGLVDGLNPCAVSTIVFLVSLLSFRRAGSRAFWLAGGTFCLAAFLTYSAIGLGLLHAFRALSGFHAIRKTLDFGLILFLLAIAYLSFRDALHYARDGWSGNVVLQLPDRVRQLIRRILRVEVGEKTSLGFVFLAGMVVVTLDGICTGQWYAPAMAWVARHESPARGLGYLLLYNLMAILPLVAALVAAGKGATWMDFSRVSRRGVPVGKALLGGLSLLLATALFVVNLWPDLAGGF